MNTTNRLQISAPYEKLFSMAADISRWPEILPHYRWVKILETANGDVKAEMAARHKGVPLWWRTIQRPLQADRRIEFTHIGGITKGMTVQWTFDEIGTTCKGQTWLVQIAHQFSPAWPPIIGLWFADEIVGHQFVQQVADKTLRRIKHLVEA